MVLGHLTRDCYCSASIGVGQRLLRRVVVSFHNLLRSTGVRSVVHVGAHDSAEIVSQFSVFRQAMDLKSCKWCLTTAAPQLQCLKFVQCLIELTAEVCLVAHELIERGTVWQ